MNEIQKQLIDLFYTAKNKPFTFIATIRFKDEETSSDFKLCFVPNRNSYYAIIDDENYANFDDTIFYYFIGLNDIYNYCNNPETFEFVIEAVDMDSLNIERTLPNIRNRMVEIGTIDLGSKIMVTDPCYTDLDAWYNKEIGIKEGKYTCRAYIEDCGVWGERIMELTINHEKNQKAKASTLSDASIAVDSGQCGFFDLAYYEENSQAETLSRDEWYNRVCEITLNEAKDSCGIIDGQGVVVSSGYGDGVYRLYVKKNTKNEIVALRLSFR